MATGTGVAFATIGKTEQCVEISYHFSMGIGRMRQIATKVVDPTTATGTTVREAADSTVRAVVVTTAKASELRSQKRLIDSPELDEIRSQDGKLDRAIKSTSAYAGESKRYLLRTETVRVWKMMEAYKTIRRPELVAAFMAKYRAAELTDFAEQKAALGDQFERSDYKPADVVEKGFDFWYTIHNVGDISLTGLPSEIVEQEKQKEREARATAVAEFKDVLRFTFKKLVDTLFDTVKPQTHDGKKRKFYDSSVDNLLEFVTNFEKQDMADDVELQHHIGNVKRILRGVTPETLKESDNQKAYIADQLAAVKQTIGALVVETGRKFR